MSHIWRVNELLFRKYFGGLRILQDTPLYLRDPAEVAKALQKNEPFTVEVPRGIVTRYEQLIEDAKVQVRNSAPDLPPFQQLQICLFGVRLIAIVLAFMGVPWLALLVSTAQYVVAPCSLFVSCAMFMALAPPLFIGHYAVWTGLQALATFLPWWLQLSLPINLAFIVVLMVLDQCLCFRLTSRTPAGPAAPLSSRTIFTHCWYGFLNCKTYELLILLCARAWGCRISLLIWLLDAHFGLSRRGAAIAEQYCGTWAFLFYTQHRMGHLPKVYDSAHKFHHTFRDSTAFDAHIYGSGMPEELICLFVESLGSCLGVCPMSMGHYGLTQSWANKLGHTRMAEGAGGMNEHADHHKEHNKNFGISNPMLDMLMSTRCDNSYAEYGSWQVRKSEKDEVVRFDWTRAEKAGGKGVWETVYDPVLARDMLDLLRMRW